MFSIIYNAVQFEQPITSDNVNKRDTMFIDLTAYKQVPYWFKYIMDQTCKQISNLYLVFMFDILIMEIDKIFSFLLIIY